MPQNEQRKQGAELEMANRLNAIARLLSAGGTDSARIESVGKAIAEEVGADAAVLYLRSVIRGAAPIVLSYHLSDYALEQMRSGALREWMEGFVTIVAVAGRTREAPLEGGFFERHEGLKWAASFPVWSAGNVNGVLILAWKQAQPLSLPNRTFCEAVASLIGLAVRHEAILERGAELAVARERARIARDIHDSVTQSITAIVLNLQAATRSAGTTSKARSSAIEASIEVARSALVDLRHSIWNLRAGEGSQKSLSESIEEAGAMLVASDVEFEVQIHGPTEKLLGEVRAALLSIARESLNNAYRHAHASRVEVLVNVRPEGVAMGITDDGVGAAEQPGPTSFGISGMRERAVALGGTVHIHTVPGLGTRVECEIPFDRCESV